MPRTLDVTPVGTDEKWAVNPINVTLIRPRYNGVESHTEECTNSSHKNCALFKKNGTSKCVWEKGEECAEILFVNSAGQQSSLTVQEKVSKLRELLNDALRGGW